MFAPPTVIRDNKSSSLSSFCEKNSIAFLSVGLTSFCLVSMEPVQEPARVDSVCNYD